MFSISKHLGPQVMTMIFLTSELLAQCHGSRDDGVMTSDKA